MGLALALVLAMLARRRSGASRPPAASGRLLVGFKKGVSSDRQQRAPGGPRRPHLAALQVDPRRRLVVVRPRSGRATDALRKRLAASAEVAYAEPDFFQFASGHDPRRSVLRPPVRAGRLPRRPRHRRPDRLGHPLELRQGGDPRHRDRHRPSRPQEQRLQERGQAEQQQGRRQERLRRRHLRLQHDQGQGSGEDDNGHGTHVSGIVAGRGNNDVGVSGTCWSTSCWRSSS